MRLSTLPIKPGYYRRSENTTDVRRCPDAAIGCSDNAACDDSKSGCRGGNVSEGNGLCHDGLTGVFCKRAPCRVSNLVVQQVHPILPHID